MKTTATLIRVILAMTGSVLLTEGAFAAKPAGAGRPERSAPARAEADSTKAEDTRSEVTEPMTEDEDKPSGLAKQTEKKSEQERKELGKGSEQGQAMRTQHSRKWWRFFGDEKPSKKIPEKPVEETPEKTPKEILKEAPAETPEEKPAE